MRNPRSGTAYCSDARSAQPARPANLAPRSHKPIQLITVINNWVASRFGKLCNRRPCWFYAAVGDTARGGLPRLPHCLQDLTDARQMRGSRHPFHPHVTLGAPASFLQRQRSPSAQHRPEAKHLHPRAGSDARRATGRRRRGTARACARAGARSARRHRRGHGGRRG